MTCRASEDKVWSVLVHPHPHDSGDRGLNNNMPRWKIPAKARNEHTAAMIENHHFLKGGFKEFYSNSNNNNNSAAAAAAANSPPRKLPPMHPGGDRKHFAPQHCEEKPWHPSFKRATIDIFPARPTGKRALTPPNEHNKTEVTDIPRGKRRVDVQPHDELAELPMFQSVRAVIDPKTGARVMDKRCNESAEDVARRRGVKKPNNDGGGSVSERKFDNVRVANEVEFRREYAARMAATTVNRDAANRAVREANVQQQVLQRSRASQRRTVQDRSRALDIESVRNLPSFVPDDD